MGPTLPPTWKAHVGGLVGPAYKCLQVGGEGKEPGIATRTRTPPPRLRKRPPVARPRRKGPGFRPAPPFPRLALPHLWAGLPNFQPSVYFTARLAWSSKKTIRAASFFFLQLQIQFLILLFSQSTTFFYLPPKILKLIYVFEALRAYSNSQKTHFGTLVL
jgi:hypothetical protein